MPLSGLSLSLRVGAGRKATEFFEGTWIPMPVLGLRRVTSERRRGSNLPKLRMLTVSPQATEAAMILRMRSSTGPAFAMTLGSRPFTLGSAAGRPYTTYSDPCQSSR